MMREFVNRKSSSWDPEENFQSWGKMKKLNSEFEEEQDELVTIASAKPAEPRWEKDGASTPAGRIKEIVVGDMVEQGLILILLCTFSFY